MATHQVGTWAELKARLSSSSGLAENDIIELTADINMNEVAPTGDTVSIPIAGNMHITLDGKNHVIKNLRTPISSPTHIFNYGGGSFPLYFTIKDLDFQNLILAGASLFGGEKYAELTLNNCRFVGSRSGAAYLVNYSTSNNIILNSCYFNLPWSAPNETNLAYTSLIPKTDSSTATTVTANYCRFKEHYGGWIVPSDSYMGNQSGYFSFSFMKISGCLAEGDARLPLKNDSSEGVILYFLHRPNVDAYTPSAQNVIDINLTCKNTQYAPEPSGIVYGNFSGVVNKQIKKLNGNVLNTNYTAFGNDSKAYPILATPEQMMDASWLASQGFDIFVPD